MTAAPLAAVAANSASVRSPLWAWAPVGTARPLRLTTTTSAPDSINCPATWVPIWPVPNTTWWLITVPWWWRERSMVISV